MTQTTTDQMIFHHLNVELLPAQRSLNQIAKLPVYESTN